MNKKRWRLITFLITLTTLVTVSCMCGGLGDKLPDVGDILSEEVVSEALEEAGIPVEELEEVIEAEELVQADEPVDVPETKPEEKPDEQSSKPIDKPELPKDMNVEMGDWLRSEEGGFAYFTIPGYNHAEMYGFVNMHAPDATEATGPLVIMSAEQVEEDVRSEDFFEASRDDMMEEEGIKVINKRTMQVNGEPGFVGDITGSYEGTPIGGRLTTVVVKGKHQFMMAGVAPKDDWEDLLPYYEAIQATIVFFPPSESDASSDFDMDIEQFAYMAEASSQYSDPGWGAQQAVGEPDVFECGDNQNAWASAGSTTVEWIELSYAVAVVPSSVTVFQTYNPDQVVKIELKDVSGKYHEIYSGKPEAKDACPFQLMVEVEVADYEADAVKVTVDQSALGSWCEIDAVKLVGEFAE
jgi:hypothetical protein